MKNSLPDKDYFSPAEVAELLMVSPITVRGWAARGVLRAETTPGGHRRFLRAEVQRLLNERGSANAAARPVRLLIVDDDELHRLFLVEVLGDVEPPVEVEAAGDGFTAGLRLAAFAPDVVLLDLMMPGMDGFEVCRRIKSDTSTRNTRVIAMTGYLSPENITNALAAGAETVIPKPIDMPMLLGRLGLSMKRNRT